MLSLALELHDRGFIPRIFPMLVSDGSSIEAIAEQYEVELYYLSQVRAWGPAHCQPVRRALLQRSTTLGPGTAERSTARPPPVARGPTARASGQFVARELLRATHS